MRFLGIILIGFTTVAAAQNLYTQGQNSISVGSAATLFVGGDAVLNGVLSNDGMIESQGHIDFVDNLTIGNLRLSGQSDQILSGEDLLVDLFELEKEGEAVLSTSSFTINNTLVLNSGMIFSSATDLHLASGSIEGGNPTSFVNGPMRTTTFGDNSFTFPIGLGQSYEPLTIESPVGSELLAQVIVPNSSLMIPGDSLIGLADELAWTLQKTGTDTIFSRISIQYEGLDLQNFPFENQIRAEGYAPVISYLGNDEVFHSLAISGEPSAISTAGNLSSSKELLISENSTLLAIGVGPISSGLHFYVPTAFSPSSKNLDNRRFRGFLIGAEILGHQVRIWNHQNKEIYFEDYVGDHIETHGWNGKLSNGSRAPQGAYFYELTLRTDQGDFEKSGTVLLLK